MSTKTYVSEHVNDPFFFLFPMNTGFTTMVFIDFEFRTLRLLLIISPRVQISIIFQFIQHQISSVAAIREPRWTYIRTVRDFQ